MTLAKWGELNCSSRSNVYLCRKAFILLSHLVCLLQKRMKRSRRVGEDESGGAVVASAVFAPETARNSMDMTPNIDRTSPLVGEWQKARGFPVKTSSHPSARGEPLSERREHDNQITIILWRETTLTNENFRSLKFNKSSLSFAIKCFKEKWDYIVFVRFSASGWLFQPISLLPLFSE